MLTLLRDATCYAPDPLGRRHLLLGGGTILWMGEAVPSLPRELPVEEVPLAGARTLPGLIDGHVHLTGGGGESGPESRVPAPTLTRYTMAGVTTAIGVLGTDDVIRTPAELVTAARALVAEGLSAWCHTGGYHLPPATLTGSVRGDLVLVDRMIGIGEVAISDHRSSQPTLDELLRLASDAHVAGLMTGKAGLVHLHVGDGPRGLALVRAALDGSELPPRTFQPTHVNRRTALFEEAIALARRGVPVDITAFPVAEGEDAWGAADALERYLASGAPPGLVTVSSDGGGCLPVFDADGRVTAMDVGSSGALLATLRELLGRGVALETALPALTRNPARLLRLEGKGELRPGADADVLVLDDHGGVRHLLARGAWMVRDGQPVRRGTFEGSKP